ncbi:MAG: calcium-binding protein, partial [Candidatus Thiodiazotropha sp.]
GANVIYGDAGADTIKSYKTAAAASDEIHGGAGNDYIEAEKGDDTLYGDDGDDSVYGGNDDDILYGGNDDDFLSGESGADTLYGGAGDDTVAGGSGDDLLYGGGGDNWLSGGGGADTFIFEDATAYDTPDEISNFRDSESDAIDLSDLLSEYDPLTEVITDFVEITNNGSASYTLAVDSDGGADNFVDIIDFTNANGLSEDEAALESSGILITS